MQIKKQMEDNYNLYPTIVAPKMDEADVLGLLLEKYTPGITYDMETGTMHVSEETFEYLDEMKKQREEFAKENNDR